MVLIKKTHSRNTLRSRDHIRRKKRIRLIKTGFIVLLVLLVAVGIVFVSRAKSILIEHVEIEENPLLANEKIRSIIEEEMKGEYLFVFPRRNALLIDQKGMEELLEAEFPKIKEASVDIIDFKTLTVSFEEREPHALWCRELDESGGSSSEECFYIDETGFIYSKAPLFSDSVFFRFYGGTISENPIGETYLPNEEFLRISAFIREFEESGYGMVSFTRERNQDGKFILSSRVENRLLRGSAIYVDVSKNPQATVENFAIALTDEVFDPSQEENRRITEIDLRFGDRIYYKFAEE